MADDRVRLGSKKFRTSDSLVVGRKGIMMERKRRRLAAQSLLDIARKTGTEKS